MRLRYLHLPRCGPLTDADVVFGREELIAAILGLPRKGSLNFVVGVNGSGKSSLLRALYSIFRSLTLREWPALPVTLAWDRTIGDEVVTAFLHSPSRKDGSSCFALLDVVPATSRRADWQAIAAAVAADERHPLVRVRTRTAGEEAVTNPLLFAHLPKRVIAYTSGTDEPWNQLDQRALHSADEEAGEYQLVDERPQGWTMDREWEEEQPLRITSLLGRSATATPGSVQAGSVVREGGDVSVETARQIMQELGPLTEIRKKVWTNQQVRTERMDEPCFRVRPRHLRYAGITLALVQAAKELGGLAEEGHRERLRARFLEQADSGDKPRDARRVLNEIDWFWPTHLSLTYRDAGDRLSPRQRHELLCLVALADEVVAQPRGRRRAVFSLGPNERISLSERLNEAFPLGISNSAIEFIAERVDACRTGAEAVVRVFSADSEIDSTPFDVFSRLLDWERTGLLEDVTLTVKRLRRMEAADGEPDDVVVAYDQLSDGEQMLLGRMGLLFLMRRQDGSLLLLDEPETHFNDVWKREIVEMLDVALLDSTQANVVLATHTSIALTDAFAAEVTVLDRSGETIKARGVRGGLFGTDPGEVTVNLFGADSSIGARAAEVLEQLLAQDWTGRDEELSMVLDLLGSSFHRAELRATLTGRGA